MSETRNKILKHMRELEARGLDCRQCPGYCCTFQFNSMQITRSEAQEILQYLKDHHLWTTQLKEKLQQTIRQYRLDAPLPGNGKGVFLRRTYTCPFYSGHHLGCELPPTVKPHGCLAFNPERTGVESPGHCSSHQELLQSVLGTQNDDDRPLPIPLAILNLT